MIMSTTRKKTSYTREFKASVLKRLEEPTNETITSLSDELGVPRTTIYQWINKAETDKDITPINYKPTSKWTSEDKFHVVLETASLNETELAEYCRRKGIYVDEVKAWRDQCLKANQGIVEDPKELKESLKAEKELNKKLERELRIKEKALAETAALLVLRKKANAIWGD
ncbi:IS3 family transposase, partial [Soehngenia saccharolytica]